MYKPEDFLNIPKVDQPVIESNIPNIVHSRWFLNYLTFIMLFYQDYVGGIEGLGSSKFDKQISRQDLTIYLEWEKDNLGMNKLGHFRTSRLGEIIGGHLNVYWSFVAGIPEMIYNKIMERMWDNDIL